MKRSVHMLVLTAGVAAVAGCGGGNETPQADRDAQVRQLRDAGLNFARCMRENGVDMPDPRTDENGVVIEDGEDPNFGRPPTRRFRAAEEQCRRHLEQAEPPKLSAEQQSEFREQALAHAKCMREQGVDFPDPQLGEDGSVIVDVGPGSGLNPDSPAFQQAEEACRDLAGGPMPSPSGDRP